jgi:hypothetical protein
LPGNKDGGSRWSDSSGADVASCAASARGIAVNPQDLAFTRARPQGEILAMMLEIDQAYKGSPEHHTPNSFDPPESLHKIDCVEKIS